MATEGTEIAPVTRDRGYRLLTHGTMIDEVRSYYAAGIIGMRNGAGTLAVADG